MSDKSKNPFLEAEKKEARNRKKLERQRVVRVDNHKLITKEIDKIKDIV